MEMLRRPSTAAFGIPTDLSAEVVGGVTAAPQPAGAMATSTIETRLPIATSSTNSYQEEGSGRLSQRVALIDPKPLTRQSIRDLLTEAVPEYAIVAVSTCEELLEIDERQFGRPNIIVVYIRNVRLTSPCVQSALELLRVRLPEASTVVLADRDDVGEVNRALAHSVRGYIPTSVEWEVAVAALRLVSLAMRVAPLFRRMRYARDPQSRMTNRKVNGRGDRTDWTSRRASFR